MTHARTIELGPDHLNAIRALADESDQPLDEVNRLYAEVLEELAAEARIKDYVTLFTARQVRSLLREARPHA